MPAGSVKVAHYRQKGVGRKQRRLVGQRVDDGRLLGAHGCSPGVSFGPISKELRVVTMAISIASDTAVRATCLGYISNRG